MFVDLFGTKVYSLMWRAADHDAGELGLQATADADSSQIKRIRPGSRSALVASLVAREASAPGRACSHHAMEGRAQLAKDLVPTGTGCRRSGQ